MRRSGIGSIVAGAIALAITSFGLAGTAHAETPVAFTSVTTANNGPQIEPTRVFRVKFRTREECERQARIIYGPRRIAWDCRPGPDRNNPIELWSD